jgi:hypothetical protein
MESHQSVGFASSFHNIAQHRWKDEEVNW